MSWNMNLNLSTVSTFLLILLVLVCTISNASAGEDKKKLKLVLDKLDKVKDAEHILKTDLSFDKVGEEEVKINGVVEQSVDFDDEYKVYVEVFYSSEKNGEYKKVISFTNLGVCQIMANQYKKYFYESLKEHANAPDPDKCPVTKEIYEINDYLLDSSKFQKFLHPGFYKIISSLKHKDEEILQYNIWAHTEEET